MTYQKLKEKILAHLSVSEGSGAFHDGAHDEILSSVVEASNSAQRSVASVSSGFGLVLSSMSSIVSSGSLSPAFMAAIWACLMSSRIMALLLTRRGAGSSGRRLATSLQNAFGVPA